ncbi:zinc-ribbon domain containing protein [Chitinimonas sp. BJB300]|uniref:zinc-ribbon domain containing protein n=1 Tax=Chitinimonas sp. BJB300 TaxID=1559339 RepID=UPI000C0D353C|nr:zinc-ribbon domain containing protein [Chitinimonas sp. BJB300]PHV10490.1 hypothetical protein CSQ89_15890 [Chitinimonas sp. BJB300]TSJ89871.1 hypothetical protein FG002_006585 [Chitinimonas sp. BJB300]
MQSGKQKRGAMLAQRIGRKTKAEANGKALVLGSTYQDLAFACRDCGARQVWAADQLQWWYETTTGMMYSTTVRCPTCPRERQLACGGR